MTAAQGGDQLRSIRRLRTAIIFAAARAAAGSAPNGLARWWLTHMAPTGLQAASVG